MLKKAALLCLVFVCLTSAAYGATVLETAQTLMDTLGIKADQQTDTQVLTAYKNWRWIKEEQRPLLAQGIQAGLIVPQNRVLAPDSTDLTSIKWGLIQYGMKTPNIYLVGGQYQGGKVEHMVTTPNTLFLDDVREGDTCTALADGNTRIVAIWKLPNMVRPAMMRGTLYVAYGNQLVINRGEELFRGKWTPLPQSFYAFTLDGTVLQDGGRVLWEQTINQNYLDRQVLWIGDSYPQHPTATTIQLIP